MKIIIVGCGKVGRTIAEQLSREGHDITVIDLRQDRVKMVTEKYDLMGVIGNGASHSVQKDAGIESSDLLIAVTDSDELNLLCCLIAKKAGDCSTIARVRNPVYNKEAAFIKEELGLSMVINPEFAAATEMARLLRFPQAIEIDTFAKGRVELLKFRIPSGSILHNLPITQISSKLRCDVLVCAVERGGQTTIPTGSFVLQERDTISIVSEPKSTSEFFRKIGLDVHRVKDAMIVGGGRLAYYLGHQLLEAGISVKIIEQNSKRCEDLCMLLPRAVIIEGDGTDKEILEEEGLKRTEAFITLTGFDEENILLSLFARAHTKAKLITKIKRTNFNEVIDNMDLDSIIYPQYITSEYILQYVRAKQNSRGSNIETLYKILDEKAEAVEFYINEDSEVAGMMLEELQLKQNILISCINRGGKIIIPRGKDTIESGDTVIVITTERLYDISDILK
ncbi:Trk system potassium transporter TrkA [Velocimicrobium porci]|uniref:Trk system potassium uptake protein TrkA n=1 Tax=Velocimicrobium porci TaxID=2606634 RepID=A0A6L5XVR2_9FIRM|nr:Trk system potassium transporter TrkA [Velocimicrobium porci]MSS62438.1 Trk system potassium transporter TrkA [Velocimicrobium porci]